jgi:mono/diheme cytochrome c family protein
MRDGLIKLAFFMLVLSAAACGVSGPPATTTANPDTVSVAAVPTLDAQRIAQGQELYDQHCAVCHGANLEGEANWQEQNANGTFRSPPHDESGHTWHHGDSSLVAAVMLGGARIPADVGGTSAMPAYESVLTDEEVLAILDYIKSTWPEEIRAIQWEQTLRERAAN